MSANSLLKPDLVSGAFIEHLFSLFFNDSLFFYFTILFTVQWLDRSHCRCSPVSCRLAFSLRTSTPLSVANNSVWRLDRTSFISPESATPFHRLNTPSREGQYGGRLLWCVCLVAFNIKMTKTQWETKDIGVGTITEVICVMCVWKYTLLCELWHWIERVRE